MNFFTLLPYLVLLFFFIYFYFVIWLWNGLQKVSKNHFQASTQPTRQFSIIIAAHNEEKHIGRTLECLFLQNYPSDKVEIVVVADRCTDKTATIVQQFFSRTIPLNLVHIQETPSNYSPKKYALQKGIEVARYPNLILMDADVQTGPDYVQTFNDYFFGGIDVLLNISKFHSDDSFLSTYLLPERLLAWSIAAAAVGHQKPFLAFGTSWGYTRQAYEQVGGFSTISHSLSGDDDLLLYQMHQAGFSSGICLRAEGWGYTRIPSSLREFIIQRRRHHSAGKFYALSIKLAYFCFHFSNFILWLVPFIYDPAIFVLLAKFLIDYFTLRKSSQIFRESLSFKNFLVFEIGYLLHYLLVAPLGFVGKLKWR